MKNSKFKFFLICFFFVACACSFVFIPRPSKESGEVYSYASDIVTFKYEKSSKEQATDKATLSTYDNDYRYTSENMGHLPFSLYTAETVGSQYKITNYFSEYTLSSSNANDQIIYSAVIKDNPESRSVPLIMLSSSSFDSSLYNTTLYFKFNDKDFKDGTGATIPNSSGNITASLTKENTKNLANIGVFDTETSDAEIVLKINLNDPTAGPNFEDGKTKLSIEDRAGLYTLKIEYNYQDPYSYEISNKCEFTTKFYILDYAKYVEGASSPLTFENTDTFSYMPTGATSSEPTDYEIFNYNKKDTPVVKLDTTKFALNFTYKFDVLNYVFEYRNSYQKYTSSYLSSNLRNGLETGYVEIGLKNSDIDTFKVNTYQECSFTEFSGTAFTAGTDYYEYNETTKTYFKTSDTTKQEGKTYFTLTTNNPYIAYFDLADFEKFLKANNINATFQGLYAFDLDFVVDGRIFDNTTLAGASSLTGITNKKLLLFGYNLKYYDQDKSSSTYHQNIELKNDVTWANFVSYNNSLASGNEFINIPQYIPITNQAPLTFDYLGNLSGSSYTASFTSLDYKTNSEETVLDYFSSKDASTGKRIPESKSTIQGNIDTKLSSKYYQGSSITSDGIKIMKLEYKYTVKIYTEIDGKTVEEAVDITGCQYFVFEINNTIQNLYIQSLDANSNGVITSTYDFDTYTKKPVRVNIEYKPNTFFVPVTVNYYYYADYDTTKQATYGTLNLKKTNGIAEKYTLDGKDYNYFLSSNYKSDSKVTNVATFDKSGAYKVVVKNTLTNVSTTYNFTIDNEDFKDILVYSVGKTKDNTGYALTEKLLQEPISNTEYVSHNLIVTSNPFSLGWNNKKSGALSYPYVYYMELTNNSDYAGALYDLKKNTNYWLTNGYSLSSPSGQITSFVNFKDDENYENYENKKEGYNLDPNAYFIKDGLYIFYVQDQAGNFFTRAVLLDTTYNKILQGYWEGDTWVDTFDYENNPANYVNKNTTIYFGSHKALILPNLFEIKEVNVDDPSYTRIYKYDSASTSASDITTFSLGTKSPIVIDLYQDILKKYEKQDILKKYENEKFVQSTQNNATISSQEEIQKNSKYFTKSSVTSPTQSDLYMYYEEDDGKYVKTNDITLDTSKTYYKFDIEDNPSQDSLLNYYELSDKKFVKTQDSELQLSTFLLTLKNTTLEYVKDYEDGEDATGAPIVKTDSDKISSNLFLTKIYVDLTNLNNDNTIPNNVKNSKFYGEADYEFKIKNINGKTSLKIISMNFDVIQGTFFAYNKTETFELDSGHYIKKNNGTNLDAFRFVYNIISDKTANYYALKDLSYDYYEFFLDDSSTSFKQLYYPFSTTITKHEDLLSYAQTNKKGTKKVIDGINLDASSLSQPGKYILTRTYVGGDYDIKDPNGSLTDPNNFNYVSTGGSYYYDEDSGSFVNLFEYDKMTRKYVIYVDHNGIVTVSYMNREDKRKVREVGDNISLTLSVSYDDEWTFKEFFLTSSSALALETNKVPVKINIPIYKYFVNSEIYSTLNFNKLTVQLEYCASETSAWVTLSSDEFDSSTKYFTINNCIKQGYYKITIIDNTGYTDTSLGTENSNNLNPTTFVYEFSILHTSPTSKSYAQTYNKKDPSTPNKSQLTNEEDPTNLATNIKKENYIKVSNPVASDITSYYEYNSTLGTYSETKDTAVDSTKTYYTKVSDNSVYLTWSDPATPYQAKVNQINVAISYYDKNGIKISDSFKIDLLEPTKYDLKSISLSSDKLAKEIKIFSNTYTVYFYVDFYNNISTPTVFDNQDYYRYTYTLKIDITQEFTYSVKLSYISETKKNSSYKDEKDNSFDSTTYTVSIDRTKPNSNIDKFLNSSNSLYEKYLVDSGYYKASDLQNFKEENFDVSTLSTTPSAFTYAFAVGDDYKLGYDSKETLSYFFVRKYDKFTSSNSSITPDMNDTVYEENKSYYDDYSVLNKLYPRFAEANLINNQITIRDDQNSNHVWYKISYNSNSTLKSLIKSATGNSNPTGFYEIIERDIAGNYRCYTIYFNEYNNIYQNLLIDGWTMNTANGSEVLISATNDNTDKEISAYKKIELTELGSKLGWATIKIDKNIKGNTSNLTTIKITPFDEVSTIESRLTNINNNYLKINENANFVFEISSYNKVFTLDNLTRTINFLVNGDGKLTSSDFEIIASAVDSTYTLCLPYCDSNRVIFLESFVLKKYNQATNTYTLVEGSNLATRDEIANKKQITRAKEKGLEKGIYLATVTDNFNSVAYNIPLHIGETYITNFDIRYQFEFSKKYKKLNNTSLEKFAKAVESMGTVYYSGGDIYVTYEANIYNVYVNGVKQNGTESKISKDYKTFTLSSSTKNSGGGTNYFVIEYEDKIVTSVKNYDYFVIYDELPDFSISNQYDTGKNKNLYSTYDNITTPESKSTVTINWGYLNFDETNLFKVYTNDDTNTTSTVKSNDLIEVKMSFREEDDDYNDGSIIYRGQNASAEDGQKLIYKIVMTNTLLGNSKTIYFVVNFGETPLYTVSLNGLKLNPSPYETLDLGSSGAKILDTITSGINNILDDDVPNKSDLKNQFGTIDTTGCCNTTNVNHYYTVSRSNTDFIPTIIYDSNINLNIIEFTFKNNDLKKTEFIRNFKENYGISANNPIFGEGFTYTDYWTIIFLVYNLESPITVEIFAVTFVPENKSLLNTIQYTDKTKNDKNIALQTNPISLTLTNTQIKDSTIPLKWNLTQDTKTWYNQGNVILLYDKYDMEKTSSLEDCKIDSGSMTTTLYGAGSHILTFKDFAGNVHYFKSNSYSQQNYYTLTLIDSVVYHTNYNDEDIVAVNYGVFNDKLKLVIDKNYLSYYSDNSLKISVTKNGTSTTSYETSEDGLELTFSNAGRYVVKISAKFKGEETQLNDAIYNFTIISSTSTRLAYEFAEIDGFEIIQVVSNGRDVTDSYKDKTSDKKIRSLFLSTDGEYIITLHCVTKTTTRDLTYSFKINNTYTPIVACNVAHGETTKGTIELSYNPSNIYSEIGDCYIYVYTLNEDSNTLYYYKTITINSTSFSDNQAVSIEPITRAGSYFVQVETKYGNVLSSYRVNKKDPLNTIAIIAIVIAVIAVVVLGIVIFKLRRHMKVK